jgi:hypothetical protein
MGCRPMVGLWTLNPAIEVRILAPQPLFWRYRLVAQDKWFSSIKPEFDSP